LTIEKHVVIPVQLRQSAPVVSWTSTIAKDGVADRVHFWA